MLTAAGQAFREEAAVALEKLEFAKRKAQWASEGKLGHIRIGFISTAGFEIVPNLMRRFRKSYPDVEFSVRNILTGTQLEMIDDGLLDVGFLRLPIENRKEIEVTTVHREPFVAILPSWHPLSAKKGIRLRELKGTGAALVALILAFGSISGAHLNPAVTLADAWLGNMAWRETPAYIAAQFAGAFAGVAAAHLMFGLSVFSASNHVRSGPAQLLSEFIATFGLLSVIWGCVRYRPSAVPFAVGTYITAAYWFIASTSFANPAVTLARSMSNTFAGIRPSDVGGFIAAQFAGAIAATLLFRSLVSRPSAEAPPAIAERTAE